MESIKAQALRDKKKYEAVLAGDNWFWDVNRLHSRFRLNEKFTLRDVRASWADFLKKTPAASPVRTDLYLHMPFCRSRCEYCHFYQADFLSAANVDAYVSALLARFRYFAPVFKGREFRHIYIGGGTPNLLTDGQMRRLLDGLFKSFSFSDDGQRTIEANPHAASPSYFGLLRGYGFNRVSFGVQTLNPAALRRNKRDYQSPDKIISALEMVRAAGFTDVNCDLILGLKGDSARGFLRGFETLARLAFGNIVVYGLMPTRNYLGQVLKMTGAEYYLRHYPALLREVLPPLGKLLKKYGYNCENFDPASWHWGFKQNSGPAEAAGTYDGEVSGCIFGVGHSARSRIHGGLEYRERLDLARPLAAEPSFEGRRSDRREEMIKFAINALDQNSLLKPAEFRKAFRVPPEKAFPYALRALAALGALKRTSAGLRFRQRRLIDKYIQGLFFFSALNGRGAAPARDWELY